MLLVLSFYSYTSQIQTS